MDRETKETLAQASKALENVTDIFNKLAGPFVEEVGIVFAEGALEYRIMTLDHPIGVK